MAIYLADGALLRTPNVGMFGGATKLFVSFRFRRDPGNPVGAGGTLISRQYSDAFSLVLQGNTESDGAASVRGHASGQSGDSAVTVVRVPVDGVQHLALVHDVGDPQSQGIYVNGGLIGSSSKASTPIASTSRGFELKAWQAGGFWLEDLVIGVGVVPTPERIGGLAAGDPAVIAALQAEGTDLLWWPLKGEAGAPAGGPGDPDATSLGSRTLAFSIVDPGTAVYDEPLAYAPLTRFGEPTVMASGRFVEVPVLLRDGGEEELVPAKVLRLAPGLSPTFRINGGPPIGVETLVGAEGSHRALGAEGGHQALGFLLEGGARVEPGDVVTWSAPMGMVVTMGGGSVAVVDAPCRNRVGRTSHDQPGGPASLRLGVNLTAPGPSYYPSYRLSRNLRAAWAVGRNRLNGDRYREDGTRKDPLNTLVQEVIALSRTSAGLPFSHGLWYLRWRDKGAAGVDGDLPCFFSLSGGASLRVTERSEFARNDARGDGTFDRVRVYEVAPYAVGVELTGSIGPDDVEIPLNRMGALPMSRSDIQVYLELDGETITSTGFATNPTRLVGCVRGVRGTAKSHAAGAAGTANHISRGGSLFLKLDGTAGKIHYSDLTLIAPEDWDPPSPPAPAPVIDVDPLELSKEYLRWASEGLGVLRAMDVTYGNAHSMLDIGEADELRGLDDQDGVSPKVWRHAVLVSAKAAVFDENTFAYFRFPGHNHQTYPVALLAPLGPAASGDRETIQVQSTATEPIMAGSRLLAGSERMRVLSGSDAEWEVIRGVDGTTPAPHAAGTIQAGWRLPLAAFGEKDVNPVVGEITTDGPHGEWTPSAGGFSPASDANPLASRDIQLAESIDATALTFAITPASPEDWDYILPGLTIRLGVGSPTTETMTLAEADPTAGTITVERRAEYGTAKPWPQGEAFRSYSSAVLCESPDGTRRRWQKLVDGKACFVTGPDKFVFYAVGKGDETRIVGEQFFDPPPSRTTGGRWSFPLELIVKAADVAKGWLWLNLPAWSSDDAIVEIARRVRDSLPAGRKVIVEVANEVWNYAFPYFIPYQVLAAAQGLLSAIEAWVVETDRRAELVRGVFAETGRGDEILNAAPWQLGNAAVALNAAKRTGSRVDVIGAAPYIRPRHTDAYIAMLNQVGDDVACDMWVFTLAHDVEPGAMLSVGRRDREALDAYHAATGNRPDVIHYEGGLEMAIPLKPVSGVDNINPLVDQPYARNRDIRLHPNWYYAEGDANHLIQRHFGSAGIVTFNCSQSPWRGRSTIDALWGMGSHPGQIPGYGDGRDGGPDNRQNIGFQGLPESADVMTSPEEGKASVRWQRTIDHNKAFFAQDDNNGGGDEDPGNGDPSGGDPGSGQGGDPDPDPNPTPKSRPAIKYPPKNWLRRFGRAG